jgi:hypothetical protein
VYTELHRYVKNILMQRRFYCPMAECEFHIDQVKAKVEQDGQLPEEIGLEYQDAIEHQQHCKFRK